MMRRLVETFVLALYYAIASVVSLAAAQGASVVGVVTAGPATTPISNARVTVRAGGLVRTTVTDADGRYEIGLLPTATSLTLVIEADGLRPASRSGIVLQDGDTFRLDAALELDGVHESVIVNAPEINRTSASPAISRAVDTSELEELPSVTRSTTKYALLDPHVRQAIGLGADFQDAARLSINAGSYRHTAHMLDGVSSYDWVYANTPQVSVSPGATHEVKVLSGQYSAQYGLSTTGVVAITTAAGSNRYDGEAFGLFRPGAWQARPALATFDVPNSRNDAGVHAGGPLRSDRTFFFGSLERATQNRGAYIQSPHPGFFTGHTTEAYGLVRIDHRLTDAHGLTVRVNGNDYSTNNANDRVAGFNQPSFGRTSHAESFATQVTDRAAYGALNELRVVGVAYTPDSATPLERSVQIVRPNYATEGFSTTNWVHARSWQVGDTLSTIRGRHAVALGGEIVRVDAHDYSNTLYGTYTFASGAPQPGEHPLTFTQTFGEIDLRYGQTQASAFVQDDVRVTDRVTANLGLRYEVQSITDARRNVAPRMGLAWDVAGTGRTIVRPGAGIFYDQYYMYLTRRFTTLGPRSPQASYTWSWGDPGFPELPNSFTAPPQGKLAGARDIAIPGERLLNPYSRQVSLSLEHQIGRAIVLHGAALHSHTYRQMRVNDINHPAPFDRTAPGQVRTPQAANQTRPMTMYEGVLVRDVARIENTGQSVYRSLDLGVLARGGWGQMRIDYVWSSSITDSMFYADANSGVPNDWPVGWERSDRGPSDFHQRHRMVASVAARAPGDVHVSSVVVAASGLPVNPLTGRDNNGDSYSVDRPVGFARNSFRGPAQFNVDMAVARAFRLVSRVSVEGRLEIFNLFNRANHLRVNSIYGEGLDPLPTFLAPVAGITNVDPSRQLQVGVRMRF